jgi:AAA+ ATPase superfamily predicted ATPase
MAQTNPFLTRGYIGPEYFCDRETEARQLKDALLNSRNITLYARRRLGKTALIRHVFHHLPKRATGIEVDLQTTNSMKDLLNALARAVVTQISRNSSFGKKLWEGIKTLRPTITYDELTGQPVVSLDTRSQTETVRYFEQVTELLAQSSGPVLIALDEFQQILAYPEENVEATLRSILQQVPQVTFIFSGSDQHLLSGIFSDTKRPFYLMSQLMKIGPIPADAYSSFIEGHFTRAKKQIQVDEISYILEWSKGITAAIQLICNRLWSRDVKSIKRSDVQDCLLQILGEYDEIFHVQYRRQSLKRKRLLKAIALADRVEQPYGQTFMQEFGFTNASSLRVTLHQLMDDQFVYEGQDGPDTWYEINDVLFARWLERL